MYTGRRNSAGVKITTGKARSRQPTGLRPDRPQPALEPPTSTSVGIRGGGGCRAPTTPTARRIPVRVRRDAERLHTAPRPPFPGALLTHGCPRTREEVHALAGLGRRLRSEEERELRLRDCGGGQEERRGRRSGPAEPREVRGSGRGRTRRRGLWGERERFGCGHGGDEDCWGECLDLEQCGRAGVSKGVFGFLIVEHESQAQSGKPHRDKKEGERRREARTRSGYAVPEIGRRRTGIQDANMHP